MLFERWFILFFINSFIYLQFGHIYTSFGSFFIQPEEEYTVDNQNILHKISREQLPIKYVAKSGDFDRAHADVSMIDDSAGDDIETTRNESDGKSYEIESTAKTVTVASANESEAEAEAATAAASESIDADIDDDSHRESLCDTCENKGKSIARATQRKSKNQNENCWDSNSVAYSYTISMPLNRIHSFGH